MTLTKEQVVSQLNRELEAVRGFERNINSLLADMKRFDPFDSLEKLAKGLSYNQQMVLLYLERASAVLELIGEAQRDEVTSGDDLAAAIQAIETTKPA